MLAVSSDKRFIIDMGFVDRGGAWDLASAGGGGTGCACAEVGGEDWLGWRLMAGRCSAWWPLAYGAGGGCSKCVRVCCGDGG